MVSDSLFQAIAPPVAKITWYLTTLTINCSCLFLGIYFSKEQQNLWLKIKDKNLVVWKNQQADPNCEITCLVIKTPHSRLFHALEWLETVLLWCRYYEINDLLKNVNLPHNDKQLVEKNSISMFGSYLGSIFWLWYVLQYIESENEPLLIPVFLLTFISQKPNTITD